MELSEPNIRVELTPRGTGYLANILITLSGYSEDVETLRETTLDALHRLLNTEHATVTLVAMPEPIQASTAR